jgi:hypothetical protein
MRGFFALLLVLTLAPGLYKSLAVYGEVSHGTGDMANTLLLGQEINEKTYEIEHGFALAVHVALSSYKGESKEAAETAVCSSIVSWAAGVGEANFSVGYVDRNDYSKIGVSPLSVEACLKFVDVDMERKKARVAGEGTAPPGAGAAFVAETGAYRASITVLVPEGGI